MYHYLGNMRLQWFFATPNMFAAFLALWLLVFAGIVLGFRRKGLLYAGVAAQLGLGLVLGATYSRGGGLAYLAGLGVLWALTRRKAVLVMLGGFLLTLLLMPAGAVRIASSLQTGEGSILHRLLLWKGGAGVIARYPLNGCPVELGRWYQLQYMPSYLSEHYNSFLNDSLSLGADYGVWAFFLFWLVGAGLLRWGYAVWKTRRNPCLAGLLAALAATLISGMFSTFYSTDWILYSDVILLAALLGFIIHAVVTARWRPRWRDIAVPGLLAGVLSAGIMAAGWAANAVLPYRVTLADGGTRLELTPRGRVHTHVVRFFAADSNSVWGLPEFPDVRRWAERGFRVTLRGIDSGLDGLRDAETELRSALKAGPEPVVVLGSGLAAANALIAAAKLPEPENLRRVAVLDAAAEWPFPELSATGFVGKLAVPLGLFYRASGEESALQLAAVARENGKNVIVCRYSEKGDDGDWLAILEWFRERDDDQK